MSRVATNIFDRLKNGSEANQPAIIRFNSMFGGGKTHTLIALAAAANYPQLVRSKSTGGLIPTHLAVDDIRLVCFTGENANLLDGMAMDGTSRRAKSLIGFVAYHLGGETAFDTIQKHDELFSDPGADDIQRLIGDQPTLILLDELVRWVAAARQLPTGESQRAANGLRNTLTAICKAVANSPHAVMVITHLRKDTTPTWTKPSLFTTR
jgi:predicted AAA+ superfamily ATPase